MRQPQNMNCHASILDHVDFLVRRQLLQLLQLVLPRSALPPNDVIAVAYRYGESLIVQVRSRDTTFSKKSREPRYGQRPMSPYP